MFVDDEAMFALDDAIAQAFKEKFASKKSILDGKAETFKCRMLKLIECYASQRERKEDILILITASILPLIKAPSSSREFKCKLIETLTHIFDIKNRKFPPVQDKQAIESLDKIFKLFIEQASKAKSADESTVHAKGINWVVSLIAFSLSLASIYVLFNSLVSHECTFTPVNVKCLNIHLTCELVFSSLSAENSSLALGRWSAH